MDKVVFSSWEGRVVDNRKGKAPTASKGRDITFPSPPEGEKALALMGWTCGDESKGRDCRAYTRLFKRSKEAFMW